MNKPYTLGIAGGTGSGKTTLAHTLIQTLGNHQAICIPHDAYYRDLSHLPFQDRAKTNFDHPDALETELLIQHLQTLIGGNPIFLPAYDFAKHTRKPTTTPIAPHPIIILEGILLLTNQHLCDLINLKIFVDTAPDIRLMRRLNRDITERGRTPESVTEQYLTTVRPMHHRFVEPARKNADLIIPGDQETSIATTLILNHLQALIT